MKRLFWSLHIRRGKDYTLSNGDKYYGCFPHGFEKKIKEEFEEFREDSGIVHLCCGLSTWGERRFDIDARSAATDFQDARNTGLPNESVRAIILDPYYSDEDFAIADKTPCNTYEFLKEAWRILRPGGLFLILHERPPRRPKGAILEALIAISMGPDRVMRLAQIWKKPSLS